MQRNKNAWPGAGQRTCKMLFAVMLWSFATSWSLSSNASGGTLETDVKAAMLYKFLSYIEWPATAFPNEESPYQVAVIGADAIAEQLRRITAHRRVNNRPVDVVEIDDLTALARVHMLFIGRPKTVHQERLVELAQQYSIVTVTENPDGLDPGSTINLRLNNGRVRFDVSLMASEASNVKLSARMLAVAASVKRGPE